jgi:hypothetical protein
MRVMSRSRKFLMARAWRKSRPDGERNSPGRHAVGDPSSPGHAQRLQRDRLQRETGFKRTDKIISFNGLNPKSKFLVFIHSNS